MKQVEFDKLMNQLNYEQKREMKELVSMADDLIRERSSICIEVKERNLKLERLGRQLSDLQRRIKDIKQAYHDKKHELICRWHAEGEYAHPTARADEPTEEE